MGRSVAGVYISEHGQSLFDICLQCYGTLRYFKKFLRDNNISSANESIESGRRFIFDDSLRVEIPLIESNEENDTIYVTSNIIEVSSTPLVGGNVELEEDGSVSLREDGSEALRE